MIEKEKQQQLDQLMQRGYGHDKEKEYVKACQAWGQAWALILSLLEEGGYSCLEALEPDFEGEQMIGNWVSDYELALAWATEEDLEFARTRIAYAKEYLARTADREDITARNMRRAVAEAWFSLDNPEEGDKEYRALTVEYPDWAWGFIGWSDMYGLYPQSGREPDYDRAIAILNEGLAREKFPDRGEVQYRLKSTYQKCGRTEEAEAITITDDDGEVVIPSKGEARQMMQELKTKLGIREKPKAGRNDPCPCGSGKKYKKCCGKDL